MASLLARALSRMAATRRAAATDNGTTACNISRLNGGAIKDRWRRHRLPSLVTKPVPNKSPNYKNNNKTKIQSLSYIKFRIIIITYNVIG